MQSQDLEVLSSLAAWLAEGRACHLCTIVATYGSSPRPVGSLLALNDAGGLAGSLSGGCVEDDLIASLRAGELAANGPTRLEYGLSPSDTERLGLPCGGTLSVVAERIEPDVENQMLYSEIAEALRNRECVARSIVLQTITRAGFHRVDAHEPLRLEIDSRGRETLRQVYGPRHQLFIIGAGMVSSYLAEMALMLDFEITVCDPRPEMLSEWSVAGVRTLCAMPDDAIRSQAMDARSAIVALTHDPRIDDMGLLEALESDALYIGAMGSSVTNKKRRKRLLALGVPASTLARLHAPIGLPIGSKTPAEIAISILAELTKFFREDSRIPDLEEVSS